MSWLWRFQFVEAAKACASGFCCSPEFTLQPPLKRIPLDSPSAPSRKRQANRQPSLRFSSSLGPNTPVFTRRALFHSLWEPGAGKLEHFAQLGRTVHTAQLKSTLQFTVLSYLSPRPPGFDNVPLIVHDKRDLSFSVFQPRTPALANFRQLLPCGSLRL